MAFRCELLVAPECPYCGRTSTALGEEVQFLWGKVPHRYATLGEPIRWATRQRRVLEPFTLVEGEPDWNFGSPGFPDLFAFDVSEGFEDHGRRCGVCGRSVDGVAVWIEAGHLAVVRVFQAGELLPTVGEGADRANIVLRRADGAFWPRTDWNNVDFSVVANRGEC